MYKYKDFFGEVTKNRGFFASDTYESIEDLVERVNQWVENEGIDVANIETLVTPINLEHTYGTMEIKSYERGISFKQVIRIWYRID